MDVRMPDGTIIKNVPEGTTKADLQRKLGAYQKKSAAISAATAAVDQARAARLTQQPEPQKPFALHAPGAIGLALDLGISGARNLGATAYGGLKGLAAGALNYGDNNYEATDAVESGASLAGEPLTVEGKAVSKVMNWPFEKWAQISDATGAVTSDYSGSPALGAGINTAMQAAPLLLSRGRGTRSLGRNLGRVEGKPPSAPKAAPRSPGLGGVPPSIEELAAQSKAAYKRASDSGVSIAPESFQKVQGKIGAVLEKEGLDPTLHPQATAAFKRIADAEGPLSLDKLETLRKIANDARGGINKADGRMAGKIVDELDDFMENAGPKDMTGGSPEGFAALKEARNLYSRKAKAEEIARLIKRAEISAPNFSASGYENALRTEFRALAKNDKKMRRFTPEERVVIEKVAKGGPLENALRMLGKFAPTGFMSGVGAMAATAVGLPIIPIAGMGGRYAATRMTRANALRAEETMRRGPPQKGKSRLQEAEEQEAKRILENSY